jgi:hypothetical protein
MVQRRWLYSYLDIMLSEKLIVAVAILLHETITLMVEFLCELTNSRCVGMSYGDRQQAKWNVWLLAYSVNNRHRNIALYYGLIFLVILLRM